MGKESRWVQVHVRVTEEELGRWREAARRHGVSVSELVRRLLRSGWQGDA